MSAFTTVWAKECRDNLRDRRTIISSFSLALLGPIAFVAMMAFIINRSLGATDDALEFAVIGADNAPQLIEHLTSQNTDLTKIEDAPIDPRTLVTSGDHELVLVIPDDYAARYNQGHPNQLALIYDSSELGSSRRRAQQLRALLNTYSQTIAMLRLQLRGIDPTVVRPVLVRSVDVASAAERALTVLSTIPYFFLLVAFMGGFYLAIDTTAGEREHGSLEPLLTQPASRAQLVLGKIAATATFASASTLLFLIAFYFSVPFVPLSRIGMSLDITLGSLVLMFLVTLPLIWFAAALLTVVGSFAKSYKEAQTYLSFIVLVPTLPVIFTQLAGVEASTLLMLVPSLAQSLLISDLITSEPIDFVDVFVSFLVTGGLGAILSYAAVRLYRSERILI